MNTGLSPYPGPVSDSVAQGSYLSPNGPLSLGTSQFGGAGIDLTAANGFPAESCLTFGTADAVSRSSGNSSTAQMEDLVGPGSINVTNCGEIKVIKHTDPRGVDQNFSYTSDLNLPGTSSPPTPNCTQSPADPTSFTLNDKGNSSSDSVANTQDCTNVVPGTYHVTETMPDGWQLENLTCTGPATTDKANLEVTFTVTAGSSATCTYQNQQLLGAIVITKTGKDKNCTGAGTPTISNGVCTGEGTANLSGAKFTIKDANGTQVTGSPATTGANGTVCVDNLPWSGTGTDYTVEEVSAPAGYSADPANTNPVTVTVSKNAKCSDTNIADEAALASFNDFPLTNISANATSVVPGATNSQIVCKDANGTVVASSGNTATDPADAATTDGLTPGTCTCTITIDP